MARNKGWQVWERQVVIEKVQKYPHNFTQAFEEAGQELGRSTGAVANQFNRVIRPELEKNKVVITAQGSSHGVIINSKNKPRRSNEKLEMVMSFVDLLSKEEKKFVAKEIFKNI